MTETAIELRGVLLPLKAHQLLLPNLSMLEVIGYRQAEAVNDSPDWLIGMINWNQRRIPLIGFDYFLTNALPEPGYRARIALCYNPEANSQIPLLAILCDAVPHLARLNNETLKDLDDNAITQMMLKKARYMDEIVWVPDLAGVAQMASIYLTEADLAY